MTPDQASDIQRNEAAREKRQADSERRSKPIKFSAEDLAMQAGRSEFETREWLPKPLQITLEELTRIKAEIPSPNRTHQEWQVPISRLFAKFDSKSGHSGANETLPILQFVSELTQDGLRWKCTQPLEVLL